MPISAQKSDFSEALRTNLKLKQLKLQQDLLQKHPKVVKELKTKGLEISRLRDHSAKIVGTSALAGSLFLVPASADSLPSPDEVIERFKEDVDDDIHGKDTEDSKQEVLKEIFSSFLPERTRPLSRNEEKFLEQIIRETTGVNARASLEGEHLNTAYGLIGAEQHLKRYPGDSLADHGEGIILKEGIAPGLGAWGYFAPSKQALTPELAEIEKWYAVVQTLYLPDWNTRQPYLKNWYKHRKVLIVNTKNGQAVVAAIADSGPAAWTGKSFGGSPEVMHHLGGPRYKKGPVLVFFVDDPNNEIPLGPVEYNKKFVLSF